MTEFADDGAAPAAAETPAPDTTASGGATAPAAVTAKADAGTLLDAASRAAEVTGSDAQQPGETVAEWRDRLADGNADLAKILSRYASPAAVGKAFLAQRQKLSEGGIPKLGPDAKPEEVAAYRKALGIPEKPEEYIVATPANRALNDVEKPILEDFRNLAHGLNIPPAQASKLAEWYLANNDRAVQVAQEQAVFKRQATEDALRVEWGGEYRANIQLANAYVEGQAPVLKGLLGTTLSDGTKLGDNPDFIRYVVEQARNTMGDTFVADISQGQGGSQTIDEQIAELSKLRFSENEADQKRFWKPEIQDKLLALYKRKERRGAA